MSDRREPLPGTEELDLGEDEEVEAPEDDEGDEDAGGDDEGEGDAGDDEGEEREARHVERPRSRSENRAQRQAQENRELRRRLEELERRPAERPQGPDPQAAAREEQEFYASLEMMAPAQAIMAVRDRERRLMGGALQQTRTELIDRQDRRDWARDCETNKTKARLAPKVEEMISNARNRGNYDLDRETAYKYALGDEIDRRGRTEAPRQRAAAQRRVQRQTVRPGSGRGDAPRSTNRRSQDSDDEALLRGTVIADL